MLLTVERRRRVVTVETTERQKVQATVSYLRRCQEARATGYPVSFTTDPAWLVNQAINRRAGWFEGGFTRGTTMPVDGRLPRKADGDWQRHLRQIASEVNTPRLVVRLERLGEHRWLADRLPGRIECGS
jgi:hypothetical protein